MDHLILIHNGFLCWIIKSILQRNDSPNPIVKANCSQQAHRCRYFPKGQSKPSTLQLLLFPLILVCQEIQ